MNNEYSITQIASTIEKLLNVPLRSDAEKPCGKILDAADKHFNSEKCDRVFMYNPDAVALWIYQKYIDMFAQLEKFAEFSSSVKTVFPPVTPVCFASMYSGYTPEKHGIQKYVKPVLECKTIFDDLPKAGKKVAIISTAGDSISQIFLNRDIDYYIYKTKQECNKKSLEVIEEDKYDLIVLYNGDYDHWMHRFGPEGKKPLCALNENIETYCDIHNVIAEKWKSHNTTLMFAPDHGCHKILGFLGTHGIDKPCDMYTVHFASFIKRSI